MTSKAERRRKKIASRVGRKPDMYAERHACGKKTQPVASERESQAKATVVMARIRQGVDASQADSKEAGYALGRLFIAGALGGKKEQARAAMLLEAGNRMADDTARYYALTGITPPNPKAIDLMRVRGLGRDPSPKKVREAADRFMRIEQALGAADEQGRPVTSLVKRIVVMDEDATNWTPSMVAKCKRGLLALASMYGLDSSCEA